MHCPTLITSLRLKFVHYMRLAGTSSRLTMASTSSVAQIHPVGLMSMHQIPPRIRSASMLCITPSAPRLPLHGLPSPLLLLPRPVHRPYACHHCLPLHRRRYTDAPLAVSTRPVAAPSRPVPALASSHQRSPLSSPALPTPSCPSLKRVPSSLARVPSPLPFTRLVPAFPSTHQRSPPPHARPTVPPITQARAVPIRPTLLSHCSK